MRLCAPARRTNLGSTTAISTRVRAQIASTVSCALRLPAIRVQSLSVQEMFVLCQQHGFEVDITVGEPANGNEDEIGFSAELDLVA
jgi:hypothetical protein